MEHAPKGPESMSEEQILERLRQIDLARTALSDSLNAVPEGIEESRQGDDNATEGEAITQRLGHIHDDREALDREANELRARLMALREQKAA